MVIIMKIIQINSVCGIGSTGRIATDLYQVLAQKGHECCIAYGRKLAPEGIPAYRIGSDMDVSLHAAYTRITDRTAFASKKATRKLIDMIIGYNPDIIHLHNLHGYYIHLGVLFQYLNQVKKPVIWSLYDCWPFTGHCCHFDYIGCEQWRTGCRHCKQKREYPASVLFDQSKKNYQQKKSLIRGCDSLVLVSPTQWLSDLLKDSYLNQFPTYFIPSGIDLEVFRPMESNFRECYGLSNQFIVLGVSNGFSKFKGLDYFVRLAKQLPEEYQLILIGVSKEQRHRFPRKVILIDRTNDAAELARYYSMADVFVNPTLQETQGLTNIEALACGTGVVTFNSGGSADCIDKSCGFVVERDNFEELLQTVIQACQCPFERKACIQKATDYDKNKLYDDYIELYKEVLGKGGSH